MIAVYGPTLNHHSIDVCFCRECKKSCALEEVNMVITQKLESEAKRLVKNITFLPYSINYCVKILKGINLSKPNFSSSKKSTLSSTNSKLQISPIRLLNEDVSCI
eukprot:TRINITY_DN5260_c0_g1_i4.p3 TRINITY_DN5260_c0_g1~~TRINITY_DN5260_c0_g1_i4.p3  ORF type:complete len:105 (+),score=12.40 TRINITY_DN5260_c0_g1_i4:250-564(+)